MTGMTDRQIADRLRHPMKILSITWDGKIRPRESQPCQHDIEAADAIERLLKERDEALEALKHADDVSVWETTQARSGFQEEIEAILSKYEAKNDSN